MNSAMKRQKSMRPNRLTVLLLGLLFSLAAAAATLDSAKEDGWIRELLEDVNAKRRARYEEIARQQGVPVSEVEKVGGQTAIEKTRPGHYVMNASGRWLKK